MVKKQDSVICSNIIAISPYIRFVGVISSKGALLAYKRRERLEPLLNSTATKNQFSHIATKTGMESKFDRKLGAVKFVWEEREKVQTISFAIGRKRVWVSIDKKVVRTEMLRIIDACFPFVKDYS